MMGIGMPVTGMVLYVLMLQRAQRGEPHHFIPRLDAGLEHECGLCGKQRDDPKHETTGNRSEK